MKKNRIRLTESQLHKLIKESVKSFINEGGHLTWKDDDCRMHTNSQDNWYGIEGATFVSHGAWSDGEIYFDYEGEQYVINANDAEEWLWNDFKEYCEENNLNPDEHSDDEIWYNFARNEGYDVLLNLGPYNESYEMNESKKRKVRLTESQLHRVIKESVIKALKEEFDTISNDDGMTFYLANGYATGEKWKAPSVDDAIKRCVKESEGMATANWLFMCTPNGTQELGRTVRVDYGWGWKFVPKD